MTQQELKVAITEAMKSRAAEKLSVLRGILSSVTNELVSKGRKPDDELSEEDLTSLIRRAAKQRKDSIEQFENGGRADLAQQEKNELSFLESLLPAQMSEEDIRTVVEAKMKELVISDKSQANQLMGTVMKDLKGKADGTLVKAVVEKLFL